MKASTKRALSALETQVQTILDKLETLRDEEQEHLEDLDPESDKLESTEEVIATLEDAIAYGEQLLSCFESFV